jgi:hypothetical protein
VPVKDISCRTARAHRKAQKELVDELLANYEPPKGHEDVLEPEPLPVQEEDMRGEAPGCTNCSHQAEATRFQREVIELKIKISLLEGELRVAKSRQVDVEQVKHIIGEILTPNQIDCIVGAKKRINWTEEELSRAFTLR